MSRQQNFVQLCYTSQHKLQMKILQNNSIVIRITKLKNQVSKYEQSYLQAIITKQFLDSNDISNVMQLQDYLMEGSYNVDQKSMQLSVYTHGNSDEAQLDQKEFAVCIPLHYGGHSHKLQINEQLLYTERGQALKDNIQSKVSQKIQDIWSSYHSKPLINQYRERFDKILQICVSDYQASNATLKNMIADIVMYLFESLIYESGSTSTQKTKKIALNQRMTMQQLAINKIKHLNAMIDESTVQKSQQFLYNFFNKNERIQKLQNLIYKVQQEIDALKKCQKQQIEYTQREKKTLEAKLHQLSSRLKAGVNQYKISIQNKISNVFKQIQHINQQFKFIINKKNQNFKQIQNNNQGISDDISQDNKKLFQLLTIHQEQNKMYKISQNKVTNISEELPLKISIKTPMMSLRNICTKFCNANSTYTCIGIQNTMTKKIVAYNKQGQIYNIQDVFFGKGTGIHSGDVFKLKIDTVSGLIQWQIKSLTGDQLFECFCDELKDQTTQWMYFILLGPEDTVQLSINHDLQTQIKRIQ